LFTTPGSNLTKRISGKAPDRNVAMQHILCCKADTHATAFQDSYTYMLLFLCRLGTSHKKDENALEQKVLHAAAEAKIDSLYLVQRKAGKVFADE
jgi:hypothetical protein